MSNTDHRNDLYSNESEAELSWHQDDPPFTLDLMKKEDLTTKSAVTDIGAGTSRLMERLLDVDLEDLSALDLSENALAAVRVSEKAVKWILADITDGSRRRPMTSGRPFDYDARDAILQFQGRIIADTFREHNDTDEIGWLAQRPCTNTAGETEDA